MDIINQPVFFRNKLRILNFSASPLAYGLLAYDLLVYLTREAKICSNFTKYLMPSMEHKRYLNVKAKSRDLVLEDGIILKNIDSTGLSAGIK